MIVACVQTVNRPRFMFLNAGLLGISDLAPDLLTSSLLYNNNSRWFLIM